MTPQILVDQLKASKEYLDRATSELSEADSTYAPDDEAFTTAQQMSHIAKTVDWLMEGGFGEGFDMNFEEQATILRDIASLKGARSLCAQSYDNAIKLIASKSTEEIFEPMPEGPIMGGDPKFVVVSVIVEHTAHHRGSLSTYTRLCGKVPPMPYADVEPSNA